MKELTKAEEQIMQILWDIEKGFVRDILEKIPEPKPAYNTVSTIVRILVKKGFVTNESYGKSHLYIPKISKASYANHSVKSVLGSYFGGSMAKMVSFFAKENNLSLKEMDEIMKHIEKSDVNDKNERP
ncbi:MAG: BlaI/MecI/CopY family transcriptional regulator [Cyclobacteriaceae bacterium]|nr:BlaI/MecI/CopY family transcriptional regulator [Cyclobacteriaceae bacterium]MCH8516986.1 BlaI/MecI/CopY family transcriptional regulator [Cyclobacteriaceae bacterium]